MAEVFRFRDANNVTEIASSSLSLLSAERKISLGDRPICGQSQYVEK